MEKRYDFSGWATRNDLRCSDGRTIRKGAFKGCDGRTVPLVWNHQHNEPENILGHALLKDCEDGVYAYCKFNTTESAQNAKLLVEHGDVSALSIYANQLKQQGGNVLHGAIREVSLVLAGANPGAYIDSVIRHGEESDEEAVIYTGEALSLCHADSGAPESKPEDKTDEGGETLEDVFGSLSEKQKTVVYALVGQVLENADESDDETDEGGNKAMKHNVFDQDSQQQDAVLSHSDMQEILSTAKLKSVGSFKDALALFAEQHTENQTLVHGIDDIETLFPEYKDVRTGAPELIGRDQGWVASVMQKTHKAPFSRIRTRQADMRSEEEMRAFGYKKGERKKEMGNVKLLSRTTDPQTVYIKDRMHNDDITDITEFDVVQYIYGIMRQNLNEELATAILIGDGRDEVDPDKIHEEHIRSIWHDDDLYAIHYDVDIEAARSELQGTNTNANFGENYIYAEAIITAALYSREKFKGSGTPDFYCSPHLLNVMLLARDLNGRRIYDSKRDLAAALNVGEIHTVEQFEGKARKDADGKTKELLGIFVNLADYQVGSTKGGEISRFDQFDIDFNQHKYLIETRLSGALTRVWSAICLEKPVAPESGRNRSGAAASED